jgi:acyl-CoA thioester hydrolase
MLTFNGIYIIVILTKIIPRVSETDGVGHINNVFIPVWFEAGRREIFKIFSPRLDFKQWRLALVKVEVEYVDQIYLAYEAEIKTGVKKIGSSSFTIFEEIYQTERLCARGQSIYVNYNFDKKKSEPIPKNIREQLEKNYSAGDTKRG